MRNTYAKTMAHELGHGLFGLDHPFIKSYGIPKGETNNLMDYTTKTPDDFLSYHEWAQIDQPVASWSLFNSDEGNMDYWDDLCAWFKGLFVKENQDELETKVGAISQLLRDVYNNYDKYYESISYDKSKKQNNTTDLNITLKGFEEWSVRGFSRSDKVCKSIYNKIISKKQEDISLHEKGIFLETYKFNSDRVTKEYKIAIYSLKQKFSITKNLIKINEKKQLTDNNYIKVGCNKKYGLLAFYDENGALQMIIQMWNTNTANPSPEEDVISWLNYLSIITSDIPSEESTSSGVWESISESIQETKKKATESLESLKSYVGEILSSIELPIFWEGGENSENKTDVIQPTGHYIVSVSDATIRKNDDRSKFENSNIPIGTEVVVESEESVDGVIVAHVKLVGSNPEQYYYTTKSNLTPIVPFDNNGETVKFRAKKKSVVLPYSSISTNKEHKVGFECNIVAKCGIYYRIYSSTLSDNGQSEENSKGFWVRGRDLSIRDDKYLSNMESLWMSQVDDRMGAGCKNWTCCTATCNQILLDAGATSAGKPTQHIFAESTQSDCSDIFNTSVADFEKALDIVERSLYDYQEPLVLCVYHPTRNKKNNIWEDVCSPHNDPSTICHFIVLVGMYYDTGKSQYYLRFYEVGTIDSSDGKSSENRLYVDTENHMIKGKTKYVNKDDYYILIAVRKNVGKKY